MSESRENQANYQGQTELGEPPPSDGEMLAIIGDEEKVLARVKRQILSRASARPSSAGDYDEQLVALRDQIMEARLEDVPPLIQEMERIQQVASRRAKVTANLVDASSPYFGRLVLFEDERKREVLIGRGTYLDPQMGVRIVDWRDAPVSRLYYRYDEGDDYEETFGGKDVEGEVQVRRSLAIVDGTLRRIGSPQGTFIHDGQQWHRVNRDSQRLTGGEGSALRPESHHRPGQLGVGTLLNNREDKYLSEITSLIDPRQFELITRPDAGLVVIQGGAGSGKTTIGLHRMAYLAYQDPQRYRSSKMLVIVFSRALARYISRVLPALGVHGIRVSTFHQWAERLRRGQLGDWPFAYSDSTPLTASRFKKHPVTLHLISRFVDALQRELKNKLEVAVEGASSMQEVLALWQRTESKAPAQRVTAIDKWLHTHSRALATSLKHNLERFVREARLRLSETLYLWAELLTDVSLLRTTLDDMFPDDFTPTEAAEVINWCRTQCLAVLAHQDKEDTRGDGEDEDVVGVDGGSERDIPTLDREDDTLLLRLRQCVFGPLEDKNHQPLRYEHLLVDEAQDLSPLELAVLLDTISAQQSVTLSGDVAQRLLMDNGFQGWRETLAYLGREHIEVEPLRLAYRSTREIVEFSRYVLGPLADEETMKTVRNGVPVEMFRFSHMGDAVGFLAESLRALVRAEPKASIALITRYPEQADLYYQGLVNAEVERVRRIADQDFPFRPGIDVTDVRQVKGLEFDYVILLEVSSASYPKDDEARHLLHIAATRAAHQLWVTSTTQPSGLLPQAMQGTSF